MSLYVICMCTAEADDECELPEGEAGIIWDAICFTVLLIQRRVFLSYYFLYVVSDLQTSKILASRSENISFYLCRSSDSFYTLSHVVITRRLYMLALFYSILPLHVDDKRG